MGLEQEKDELKIYIKTFDAIKNSIFIRNSKRRENTQLADFIHGHCLRFQDFVFAVEKADKSVHIPYCLECGMKPDSPYHQIIECPKFDSLHKLR